VAQSCRYAWFARFAKFDGHQEPGPTDVHGDGSPGCPQDFEGIKRRLLSDADAPPAVRIERFDSQVRQPFPYISHVLVHTKIALF